MGEAAERVHHVMWTGGWDSTFRVADLVITHGRSVQPWYVIDPERRTTERELRTMVALRQLIDEARPGSAALIRPLETRRVADLPPDPVVTDAVAGVSARNPISAQHTWLPLLPRAEGIEGMEIGWERNDHTDFFTRDAYRQNPAEPPDDWYRPDAATSPPDSYALFEPFRFPLIMQSKLDMMAIADERGFRHVLEATWACRWPTILGNPCGFCVPCVDARTAGLVHRVPRPTRTRRSLHRAKWGLARRRAQVTVRARAAAQSLRGQR